MLETLSSTAYLTVWACHYNVIWNNSFHHIFLLLARECQTFPDVLSHNASSSLSDQSKLLFWKKMHASDNVILYTVLRTVGYNFMALGSRCGVTSGISQSVGWSRQYGAVLLLVKFIKQNQNYYLKLDVSTSIRGLHRKKLVFSSSGSSHDGKTPWHLPIVSRTGRTEYQLLLMKASDRGRNVKFYGNNFGCVWWI